MNSDFSPSPVSGRVEFASSMTVSLQPLTLDVALGIHQRFALSTLRLVMRDCLCRSHTSGFLRGIFFVTFGFAEAACVSG